MMATIRDVAARAGVAVCTVSRVLNGSAAVSPKTKARITDAMAELDYVPNELARGMFRQKSGIVSMLVPSIRHMFFGNLAHFVERELYRHGYKLMLCSTDGKKEREAEYMRTFRSNLVDGVILGVASLDLDVYENFKKPLITTDIRINDSIPVVVSDNDTGGALAADAFIRRGCKCVIQLISASERFVLSLQRHLRFAAKLRDAGIAVQDVEIKWDEFDYHGYQELAQSILDAHPEIDGVMAADMPACAFLKAAIRMGRRVPEEFCVVAYDGTYLAHVNTLDMTAVSQPLDEMAAKMVEVLLELIDGSEVKGTYVQLPVSFRQGETA
ncbi:MAG: LacI family DNA-binding transcriptional regulator [Lachnospiraceae bacterium]|jgi:LacI family sucrose operon transcriptional repressor|nr:LacI family DNA-binding transcriptional regulator [Lachnospiraceae bacterium]